MTKKTKSKLTKKEQERLLFLHSLYNVDPCYRSILIKHLNKKSQNLVFKVFKDIVQDKTELSTECKKRVIKSLVPFKKKLRTILEEDNTGALSEIGGRPLDVVLSAAIPHYLE